MKNMMLLNAMMIVDFLWGGPKLKALWSRVLSFVEAGGHPPPSAHSKGLWQGPPGQTVLETVLSLVYKQVRFFIISTVLSSSTCLFGIGKSVLTSKQNVKCPFYSHKRAYFFLFFIVWKGRWFWHFTHFGAIKSPRRSRGLLIGSAISVLFRSSASKVVHLKF